jgi:hypothetical protein
MSICLARRSDRLWSSLVLLSLLEQKECGAGSGLNEGLWATSRFGPDIDVYPDKGWLSAGRVERVLSARSAMGVGATSDAARTGPGAARSWEASLRHRIQPPLMGVDMALAWLDRAFHTEAEVESFRPSANGVFYHQGGKT